MFGRNPFASHATIVVLMTRFGQDSRRDENQMFKELACQLESLTLRAQRLGSTNQHCSYAPNRSTCRIVSPLALPQTPGYHKMPRFMQRLGPAKVRRMWLGNSPHRQGCPLPCGPATIVSCCLGQTTEVCLCSSFTVRVQYHLNPNKVGLFHRGRDHQPDGAVALPQRPTLVGC